MLSCILVWVFIFIALVFVVRLAYAPLMVNYKTAKDLLQDNIEGKYITKHNGRWYGLKITKYRNDVKCFDTKGKCKKWLRRN